MLFSLSFISILEKLAFPVIKLAVLITAYLKIACVFYVICRSVKASLTSVFTHGFLRFCPNLAEVAVLTLRT